MCANIIKGAIMMAPSLTETQKALAAEVEYAFDLLAVRIIRALTPFLPRRVGLRRRGVALSLIMFVLVNTIDSRVLARQGASTQAVIDLFTLILWGMGLFIAEIASFDIASGALKNIFRDDIVPALPDDVADEAAEFVHEKMSTGRQVINMLIAGLVVSGVIGWVLYLNFQRLTPATYLAAFFIAALVANTIHLANLFTALTRLFSHNDDIALYPLDARQSPIVRGSTAITRRIVLVTAFTATISIIGPFLLPSVRNSDLPEMFRQLFSPMWTVRELSFSLSLVAFAGAVGAIIVPFFMQQANLTRMVSRRHTRTLSEIQADLNVLYTRRNQLDEEERARFETLLALHERISAGGGRAFSLRDGIDFLAPLLLPLLSLLGGNPVIEFFKNLLEAAR